MSKPIPFLFNDGGRKAAGFKGFASDCVCRAIAIALDLPYIEVYRDLADACEARGEGRQHARNGVWREVYESWLKQRGWIWTPTMFVGQGCKVHLRSDELPAGRLIVRLSHHLVAVVGSVLHDISDCSRGGTRCVYGYFAKKGSVPR